jgi:alpha-tubulin suppressor-like RCC1 family protein/outer membrane protein assembly factor BamB
VATTILAAAVMASSTTLLASAPAMAQAAASGETSTFQIDAIHSGALSGGTELPPLAKRWTRQLGGTIGFPLVAQRKVFAIAPTGHGTEGYTLYALDAATGKDVWGPIDLGVRAQFTYGDGVVFVLHVDGIMRAFDAATGRQRWITRVVGTAHWFDAPPVYRAGVVYAIGGAYGGQLYAITAATGKTQWSDWPLCVGDDSAPAVSDVSVFASHGCQQARAWRVATGQHQWSRENTGSGGSGLTPAVFDGLLWTRGGSLGIAYDVTTAEIVLRFAAGAPPAFLASRGFFLANGTLQARSLRGQEVLWSFTGDGGLTSAPIVVNGYVYVGSASGRVWALEAETGAVAWSDNAGAPILGPSEDLEPQRVGLGAGQGVVVVPATNLLVAYASVGATLVSADPSPPPILRPVTPSDDETGSYRIDLAHRNALTNGAQRPPLRKRWTRDLGSVNYAVLAHGKVFVAAGHRVFALDAETGADLWAPFTLPSTGERAEVGYGDGRLFVAASNGPLRALDADTGAVLWQTPVWTEFYDEHVMAAPLYYQGLVYALTNEGIVRVFAAGTGREVRQNYGGGGEGGTPAIVDGVLYVIKNCQQTKAFDAVTGALLWQFGGTCATGGSTTPVVADGKVWAVGKGATPLVLDAGTGVITSAFTGRLPALDGARAYVRDGLAVKAVEPQTQFLLWKFTGEPGVKTDPVVVNGTVYVGSSSGRVLGLDAATGTPVWQDEVGAPISGAAAITAGQGLIVVAASNLLVAYEPVVSPPPPAVVRPSGWGWNPVGQVGDGTTVERHSPTDVAGLSGVIATAAGGYHNLALKDDGTVWAWGWNGAGQLGDGTTVDRHAPVRVPGFTDVVAIAAGTYHSLAVKRDGTAWAWGWNALGQLGDGTAVDRHTPVRVAGLSTVAQVTGGALHSLARLTDGTAWAWGWNGAGQLGDGTVVDRHAPVRVKDLTGVIAVSSGWYHSLAITGDGRVWGWGWNAYGQLGDATRRDRWTPVQVAGIEHAVGVSGGALHAVALRDDGTAWAWGWNGLGAIGDGTTADRIVAVQVPGLRGISSVAAGAYHSVASTDRRMVVAWGWNGLGQLGDGTTTDRRVPTAAGNSANVTAVSAGAGHSLAN